MKQRKEQESSMALIKSWIARAFESRKHFSLRTIAQCRYCAWMMDFYLDFFLSNSINEAQKSKPKRQGKNVIDSIENWLPLMMPSFGTYQRLLFFLCCCLFGVVYSTARQCIYEKFNPASNPECIENDVEKYDNNGKGLLW